MFKKLIKRLKEVMDLIILPRTPDPVYGCKRFKDIGCSLVDEYLCDYPDCTILKEYLNEKNS